jgi:hypothetical protein
MCMFQDFSSNNSAENPVEVSRFDGIHSLSLLIMVIHHRFCMGSYPIGIQISQYALSCLLAQVKGNTDQISKVNV